MSVKARAALGARDGNHGEIAAEYERLFCKVHDTHIVGGGFGDMVVGIPTQRGRIVQIVEVKMPDGALRPNQRTFADVWGSGAVVCVQTRGDVFAHVARIRAAFKMPT